jgi:hypothetical protein
VLGAEQLADWHRLPPSCPCQHKVLLADLLTMAVSMDAAARAVATSPARDATLTRRSCEGNTIVYHGPKLGDGSDLLGHGSRSIAGFRPAGPTTCLLPGVKIKVHGVLQPVNSNAQYQMNWDNLFDSNLKWFKDLMWSSALPLK